MQSQDQGSIILRVPLDVLFILLRRLTLNDALSLFLSCKHFLRVSNERPFWIYANIDVDTLLCRPGHGRINYSDTPTRTLQSRVTRALKVFLAWRSEDVTPKRIRTLAVNRRVRQLVAVPWTRTIVLLLDDSVSLQNWDSNKSVDVPLDHHDGLFLIAIDVFWVESISQNVLVVSRGCVTRFGHHVRSELQLFAINDTSLSAVLLTKIEVPFSICAFTLSDRSLGAIGHTGTRVYYMQSAVLTYGAGVKVTTKAFVRISLRGTLASSSFTILDDDHFLIANPTGLFPPFPMRIARHYNLNWRVAVSICTMVRPVKPKTPLKKTEGHRFLSASQHFQASLHLRPEDRYARVDACLGAGRYSRVVPALDRCTDALVAIKKLRRNGELSVTDNDFDREIRTLTKLSRLPTSSIARFCELQDHFISEGHFFMVFALYGDDLSSVLVDTRVSSMPIYQAKEISRQLIQAVRFLHDHGITHTDIQPSNIVFLSSATTTQTFYGMDNVFRNRTILKSTEIRLVDFGSIAEGAPNFSGMVGSVGYRAPEVILKWRWTKTIDYFAIGCVIARLLTYAPLLPVSSGGTLEYIAIMDRVLGPFSDDMVATIEKDLPGAFVHRKRSGFRFSYSTATYLDTAKSVSVRANRFQ
ncbi:kinase-like domain-containing protein [Mycena crocata]|nr:kinase-like domain-containing protein [Mycena crocata]